MSTLISKAALAALGLLAACATATQAPERATVTVAGRDVVVVAPPGFCVDAASTNVSATGAFVLVGDCALLGLAEGDADPAGAVLTASISAAPLAEAAALDELGVLGATAQGRAVLGRSGRSDRVRVQATRSRNGVLYMLIEDRGPQPIAGLEPQFWRAFLQVRGRMAVLSVLGFEGAGIGPTEGLAYIQAFADAIQRANAG